MVAVLPVPMPIVTLPPPSVVVVTCAVLKVMLLPSTTRDEPLAGAVARPSVVVVPPTSSVAAVTVSEVSESVRAVPATVALTPLPRRLSAVAPAMAVDVTVDFVV